MTRLCALYGVTRAGYYAWQQRCESARRTQDRVWLEDSCSVPAKPWTYGSPRISGLCRLGVSLSRRRGTPHAMADCARTARLYRANPGCTLFAQHPNHLDRDHGQPGLGRRYHLSLGGRARRYLAVVMDQYSCRIWLGPGHDTRYRPDPWSSMRPSSSPHPSWPDFSQ